MNYLLLCGIVAGIAIQNVFRKQNDAKNTSTAAGNIVFNMLLAVSALVFFIIISKGSFAWHTPTALFAAAFGICFASAIVFLGLAIKNGSLALTSLVVSYSLLVPAVSGLLILKENVTYLFFVGVAFLAVSLYCIGKKNEENKITAKWVLFVFFAFLSNGMCSSVQNIQQVFYNGMYKTEFMIIAMGIAIIICGIILLFMNKREVCAAFKSGKALAAACGIANALVNYLCMVLAAKLPASVLFPTVSAGGIIAAYFIAKLWYKEKLTKMQTTGLVLGIIAVILLNI